MFFFCCAPSGAATFRRGQSKKKNHPGCFCFCSGPGERQGKPRAGAHSLTAGLGGDASARRGHSKKQNTPGGVFFCCGPARMLTHSVRAWVAMPRPGGATAKKKKHPGWCFFFAAAPRGRSLTDCGPGWRCLGPAGPQQKKKTPRVVLFLLRPRRFFLDNSKKCLGYYIGSKKARRGHSKKKKHHFL